MTQLTPMALERRRNAKPVNVGFLVFFTGILTSIPVSIRQKDWRLWCFPFCTAIGIVICGAVATGDDEGLEWQLWKLAAAGSQGAVCGLLVQQNKEEALQQRDAK